MGVVIKLLWWSWIDIQVLWSGLDDTYSTTLHIIQLFKIHGTCRHPYEGSIFHCAPDMGFVYLGSAKYGALLRRALTLCPALTAMEFT